MRRYLAEFWGTFILVFFGTGAAIINEITGGSIGTIGVALAFGLIVTALIFLFGKRSGAHINPAVTIAFTINKVFPASQLLPYIGSQFMGAICASYLLKLLFPLSINLGATTPSGSALQSWILEILLTFILMLTILFVAKRGKEKGQLAAVVIGFVVFLEAWLAGPITGASMNPARSLAPALASLHLQFLWIYLTAPVAGSLAAVGFYRLLKYHHD